MRWKYLWASAIPEKRRFNWCRRYIIIYFFPHCVCLCLRSAFYFHFAILMMTMSLIDNARDRKVSAAINVWKVFYLFFLPPHRVKLDKSFINYVVARSLYTIAWWMEMMMVRVLFLFIVMIFLILNYHQKTIQRPESLLMSHVLSASSGHIVMNEITRAIKRTKLVRYSHGAHTLGDRVKC